MTPRRALIVGAGIGGLAAGVALRRAGWQIRIYERAASPRELGFGLLLASNALAALRELGVAGAITTESMAPKRVEIRRADGRLIRRFDAQIGGPSVVALRPDLHGALLDAVGSDALALGREAVSFSEQAGAVRLTLRDGGTDTGDILIGADGVRSMVRSRLHPNEPPARSSGYCAVRGVAHGAGGHLGDLAAISYLDSGVEAATARAGRDSVYWYLSLLATDLPADARTPEAILSRLAPGFEPAFQRILSATTPDDMRFDDLLERDPLSSWGIGRVTLLGDAAHPVLPHTGQGAAQALEDAVALGLAVSRADDIDAALRKYEHVRSRRTRAFVKMGKRIARITTTRSAAIQTLRTLLIRLIPAPLVAGAARRPRDPHRALRAG